MLESCRVYRVLGAVSREWRGETAVKNSAHQLQANSDLGVRGVAAVKKLQLTNCSLTEATPPWKKSCPAEAEAKL